MKKSELKSYIKEMIVAELTTVSPTTDASEAPEIAKSEKTTEPAVKDAIAQAKKTNKPVHVAEEMEDDAEPTASDIAANASIAKLKSKYEDVTKQMKAVVNKYKSAEGAEKDKYVAQLKNLTKLKKEIEAMINPTADEEED
jgi:hypothetical protein